MQPHVFKGKKFKRINPNLISIRGGQAFMPSFLVLCIILGGQYFLRFQVLCFICGGQSFLLSFIMVEFWNLITIKKNSESNIIVKYFNGIKWTKKIKKFSEGYKPFFSNKLFLVPSILDSSESLLFSEPSLNVVPTSFSL